MSRVGEDNPEVQHAKRSPYYVKLSDRADLIDTWQLKYIHAGERCKALGTRDILQGSGDKELFLKAMQSQFGDHHPDTFYQGERKSSKIILVTGCPRFGNDPKDPSWTGIRPFAGFGQRARFIDIREKPEKKPRGYGTSESGGYNYPWRFVICGSAVDVDDALRFACSLVFNNWTSTRSLDIYESRYLDTWSGGSGREKGNPQPPQPPAKDQHQRDPRVAAVGGGGGGAPASLISAPQAASSSSSSSSSAAATRTSDQQLLTDLLRENSTLRSRVEQFEAENKRLREGGQGGSSKRQRTSLDP
mmetsp:Transcript_28616/g.72502  ORF Transcript_28616/g.72502 Transcript_28616/m.72502 type:complete len:303 (-) Transcript_28616:507-1415(-)